MAVHMANPRNLDIQMAGIDRHAVPILQISGHSAARNGKKRHASYCKRSHRWYISVVPFKYAHCREEEPGAHHPSTNKRGK